MVSFERSLPHGFTEKISAQVVTMRKLKEKQNEIVEIYNSEMLFSRVTYALSINQIDMKNLFDYELAHVPTSLFKDNTEARYPTNKADLKNDLKVDISSRNIE